ncbi:MAG: heme lyase CcmF/NrfE family subunit [Arenicellales bacterium]|nr:heme lyase CcmF/NrfE family subunit [Arenicellales bacterium]
MIAEIGHFALILALTVALVQATLPMIGAARDDGAWMALARPAAGVQWGCVVIAFAALTHAYVTSDFSVLNVANNSHSAKPLLYKISGVWGNHEGSLLLWVLILATFGGAVALFGGNLPPTLRARVLSVQALIAIGFLLFTLTTSNPFERLVPAPMDGADLNPLLQDPGLAFHPPFLYLGYVGFSIAFAFAMAALIEGRVDVAWARWVRPWTLAAWSFLTLGIALGSWWAYYELGWGGWWFWDPVENASFMPWLVGTALIHSLAATEKRGVFKAWTVLLAVFAFSLSLLGTFLVRSGVLTSVHAFATDPTRGLFILVFLAVVVGGSLALYAWRAPAVRSSGGFNLVSREAGLLLNNVLLVVSAATILLGTLYPLVIDALGLGKISVGPPYFNAVFIPLTAPLAILVGVGSMLRWKKDQLGRLVRPLGPPFALALVLGLLWPAFFGEYRLAAVFGGVLGLWTIFAALAGLWGRTRAGQRWQGLARTPGAVFGMSLAHIGLGVFVIGITLTSTYSVEKDLRMAPGETYTIGGYTFRFDGINQQRGPNYLADTGTITVLRDNQLETVLNPEKRTYLVQQMPMTEAAIDAGLTRDLYVALGEPLGDGSSWAVRLYFKPYVRWIWLGALIMVAGGLLSASDKRYRKFARETNVAPAPDTRHAAS